MNRQRETEILTSAVLDAVEVRAIDDDARTVTFVAATENGVETYWGREYLRMSGASLDRYRKNPVLLDAHNRYEAGAVIGKATKVTVKNRELTVEVLFAETVRAEEIWELVRGRFLNALSIGFIPGETQVLEEGESSGTGKGRIEGPARIVKEWELYEVSVVPIPADAEALRRNAAAEVEHRELLSATHRLVQALENRKTGDQAMTKPTKTPEPDERAAGAGETKAKPDDANTADGTQPSGSTHRQDASATQTELRSRDIRAICPRGLEPIAEQCILENLTVDDARKRMLEEHAKRTKPVGTPEPKSAGDKRSADGGETELKDVSDEELTRSLCG